MRAPQLPLVVLFLSIASALGAQCPDGTPPPCASRRVASAATTNPPLNPRTWIVVPFGNVTRAPEAEWVREASVNLLTLEIGRWTDVQVVNDKHVSDLVRELPAARRSASLTLSDGIQLAKRAGAGMLVMGDFIKQGKSARLTANVFDVRTGNRVRTSEQRLADADSLLSAFGPLSRGVLSVPPPPDSRSGEIGTARLDAYQAYLAGVRALNKWDLEVAERELMRALSIDSTFALAHLFLAMKYGWTETASFTEATKHALAAQRLGASLPPRERALIAAEVGIARSDYETACKAVQPLVKRDSNDVLALYMLGDCAYHDRTVIAPPSDTLPGTIPWGWNLSLSAMRRVLQLDPSFHQAFQHILDILRATQWSGCVRRTSAPTCENWPAAILRDKDTLVIRPVSQAANRPALFRQQSRGVLEKPMHANLAIAKRVAEDWMGADSTNEAAHFGMASVLLSLGDLEGAEARFRKSGRMLMTDATFARARMEVAMKRGDAPTARAWFDSVLKLVPDNPAVVASPFRGSMELVFGKARRVHTALDGAAQRISAANGSTPEALAYARLLPRVILGLPTPQLAETEAAYLASMKDTLTCNAACRMNRVFGSLVFGMRAPRASWPKELRSELSLLTQSANAITTGDTASLRSAAVALDSSARARVAMLWPDDGHATIAAEGYLALRDSANALRMLRFAVDSAMPIVPVARTNVIGMSLGLWWVRGMLMRAELAAAMRQTEEARKWYDRVLAMWSEADPEFQEDIARIRAARAALGTAVTP
jgi:tetratricopeptide (TPR) repeat protein